MDVRSVLAIDCGGSHSTAMLIRDCEEVDIWNLGAANLWTQGPESVATMVVSALSRAGNVHALAISLAGLRDESDRHRLLEAIREANIVLPVAAYPDTRCALRAADIQVGVVVVAGTGSAGYARDGEGREVRVGGWGRAFGDEGSGYWIGKEWLSTLARAADEGTEPHPSLAFTLTLLGVDSLDQARVLAASPHAVPVIARLTKVVAMNAQNGDAEAVRITEMAADELARLARLASTLGNLSPPVPLLLAGGVWKAITELKTLISSRLGENFVLRPMLRDPAYGAYLLASEEGEWDQPSSGTIVAATERVNPATVDLHSLDTSSLLAMINREDQRVPPAVERTIPQIATMVEATVARLRVGGRLIYAGAGTSGRIAMLDAVECVPTFGTDPGMVIALVAGGTAALSGAVEGAEDDEQAGILAAKACKVSDLDVVVGISASGSAAYVRGVLREALAAGAFTGFITCNPDAPLLADVDIPIPVAVGPEVLAGSTRLKSGTAQKLVLNMLSTGTMIGLGRTLGNRMVAMRPTNQKLRDRAIRMVCEIAKVRTQEAQVALESHSWDISSASLVLMLGDDRAVQRHLAETGGDARTVLQSLLGKKRS